MTRLVALIFGFYIGHFHGDFVIHVSKNLAKHVVVEYQKFEAERGEMDERSN